MFINQSEGARTAYFIPERVGEGEAAATESTLYIYIYIYVYVFVRRPARETNHHCKTAVKSLFDEKGV